MNLAISEVERCRVEEIARLVADLARTHLGDAVEVYWFGSWATGRAVTRSDIDVGVRASRTISHERMALFRAAVGDLPTLYSIDLVDLSRCGDRLRTVALRDGIPL